MLKKDPKEAEVGPCPRRRFVWLLGGGLVLAPTSDWLPGRRSFSDL